MKKDDKTFGSFGLLPGLLFIGIILFGYAMAIVAFAALILIPILIIVLLVYAFFSRDTKEERILNKEIDSMQNEIWRLEEEHRTKNVDWKRWDRICNLKEEIKPLYEKRNLLHWEVMAYKESLNWKDKMKFAFAKKIKK